MVTPRTPGVQHFLQNLHHCCVVFMRARHLLFGACLVAVSYWPWGSIRAQHPSETSPSVPFRFRDVGAETGFAAAVGRIHGHGAAWGDIDNDGWADLYIGTFHYRDTQPNLLLRNRGGRFELGAQISLRISTRATGVVFADFDNDDDLDLFVGSMPAPEGSRLATKLGYSLKGCSLFRNDGDGHFKDVTSSNADFQRIGGRSATVLDFDGDGLLDLLVGEEPVSGYSGSSTKQSRLFRNRGELRFEDATQQAGIPENAAGLGVAASDLNGDGWPDFVLASTLGNYVMLNDASGSFEEAKGTRETFAWPTAKGDDMVCGVAIGDVNGDALPDIVLAQHYGAPWKRPVANRLYLNRGVTGGTPEFEDVTETAGLIPLPMKGPHVEIQDFDNDGRCDILVSIVTFDTRGPHPLIFRNVGNVDAIPRFRQFALGVNDFPTGEDVTIKRSGAFFEKMIADKKITYSAPGPTCDFDRDGRLDIVLPSWWVELPSLLLKNESQSGNWLEIQVRGTDGVNRMGIGSRVELFKAGMVGEAEARIGVREIATGYGYASSQQSIAHFGLGTSESCDVVVTLPHGKGQIVKTNVKANQRITVTQ